MNSLKCFLCHDEYDLADMHRVVVLYKQDVSVLCCHTCYYQELNDYWKEFPLSEQRMDMLREAINAFGHLTRELSFPFYMKDLSALIKKTYDIKEPRVKAVVAVLDLYPYMVGRSAFI